MNKAFSETQLVIFNFFETQIKKSQLFPIKEMLEKKLKELDKKNLDEMQIKAILTEVSELQNKIEKQRVVSASTEIPDWIDKAVIDIKKIMPATHPIKLTHSSIKGGTSIYAMSIGDRKAYLTTAAINNKKTDIAYFDAKLAPIGKFLLLTIQNELLFNKFVENDFSAIKSFSKNEKQLTEWKKAFLHMLELKHPVTHQYAKQIYFPVNSNYHLLSPLLSSTMQHALFEKLRDSWGKESVAIRKSKRDGIYDEKVSVSFPDTAIIRITASQHQNASPLNGKRNGKNYLLNCAPPNWTATLKPPLNTRSIFDDEYDRRAWKTAKELQSFLVKLHKKKGNMDIRKQVKQLVHQLIDTLLDYVAEIHNLKEQAGWSENADELKQSHKLWLDPYRQDEEFQDQRTSGEWQTEVCKDFGVWLNKKLEHKKMLFGKIESKHWAKLLKNQLREFERDMELPV